MPHAAQISKNVFGVRREAYVPNDVLTHILLQNYPNLIGNFKKIFYKLLLF